MASQTDHPGLTRLASLLRMYFHPATPDGERDAANAAVQRAKARLLNNGITGLTIDQFIEHIRLGGTADNFGSRKKAGRAGTAGNAGAKARTNQRARPAADKAKAKAKTKPAAEEANKSETPNERVSERVELGDEWLLDLYFRLGEIYGVDFLQDSDHFGTEVFAMEGTKPAMRAFRAAVTAARKRVEDRIEEVIASAEAEGRRWKKSR